MVKKGAGIRGEENTGKFKEVSIIDSWPKKIVGTIQGKAGSTLIPRCSLAWLIFDCWKINDVGQNQEKIQLIFLKPDIAEVNF